MLSKALWNKEDITHPLVASLWAQKTYHPETEIVDIQHRESPPLYASAAPGDFFYGASDRTLLRACLERVKALDKTHHVFVYYYMVNQEQKQRKHSVAKWGNTSKRFSCKPLKWCHSSTVRAVQNEGSLPILSKPLWGTTQMNLLTGRILWIPLWHGKKQMLGFGWNKGPPNLTWIELGH